MTEVERLVERLRGFLAACGDSLTPEQTKRLREELDRAAPQVVAVKVEPTKVDFAETWKKMLEDTVKTLPPLPAPDPWPSLPPMYPCPADPYPMYPSPVQPWPGTGIGDYPQILKPFITWTSSTTVIDPTYKPSTLTGTTLYPFGEGAKVFVGEFGGAGLFDALATPGATS